MKKQEILDNLDDELLDKLFAFCYARTNDSYEAQELCSDVVFALVKAAQALAAIRGRDYVTPQEVKELAPYVLGHRLSGSGFETESGQNYILALVNRIEVPVEKL